MQTYNSFKDQVSSEKITLATLEPSKRLIAFTFHGGGTFKIENFDYAVITTIKDSGVPLTEVQSLNLLDYGTFFNDRTNKVLYLAPTEGNPNARFIHMTFKLFFSSAPVTLPHDLNNGYEVYWEPQIQSTSQFGVEIDTINQQSETIEGSGSLTLLNDQTFWPANFDKLFFDNQNCKIYSWNRELAPTEAKLLFKGKVESKTYKSDKITFKLKDLLAQLRNVVDLKEIKDLNLKHSPNMATAKQRMIYGRVFGFKPVNVDSLIDGKYILTGTVSITSTQTTLVGVGTQFLKELNPDDRVRLNGTEYTVASVTSNTALELTEAYKGNTITGGSVEVAPSGPKRWINRKWKLAGHPLRKPTTTIHGGSSTGMLFVGSTKDMFAGNYIYVGEEGDGDIALISEVVNSTVVKLATSLPVNPAPGTTVFYPSVQNLRINDVQLIYERDYTVDSETATLTLTETAEVNAASTRESLEQATFQNGSRTVTGTGTFFKTYLKSGYVVRPKGTSEWFEILSVDTDESLTLRTEVSGLSSTTSAQIQYKSLIFSDNEDTLSCEIIGRTDDNTTSGNLLRKAPEIVKQLVLDAGFSINEIDQDSFTNSQDLVPEDLGFVIPKKFNDKNSVTYRDVINSVNKSVFGILFQDNDFKLTYGVLRPVIPANPLVIKESDVISWSCESTNKNMLRRTVVEYNYKEYDYNVKEESITRVDTHSDLAKYIFDTSREKIFTSLATNEADAQRLSDRWKFLLEFSTNTIVIQTKLQMVNAEVNDIVDFEHRKFYERFSGTSKRKFLAIEKIQKNGTGVVIECVDLSNAFNRIALISDTTTNWANSGEETRIHSGFITDENGLIDNDENSFQVNLIW